MGTPGNPLQTKWGKNKNLTYGVLGIKIGGKKGMWISFLKEFLQNIKKLILWFYFFFKSSNFDAFFRPSTLKTENLKKINKGRLCVYREIVWYHFVYWYIFCMWLCLMRRENHPCFEGLRRGKENRRIHWMYLLTYLHSHGRSEQ